MYVVYDTETGRALSIGSVEPESLPEGTAYADVGSANTNTHTWDQETRTMVENGPVVTHIISRRAYLARIGITRVGLLQVIRTTTEDMNVKAALEAFQLILSVSPDVDLTFPETVQGTEAIADILESQDALPEGKQAWVAEILAPEGVA